MLDESLESKCKMTKKQTQIILMNKISILLRKGRIPEAQKILREI